MTLLDLLDRNLIKVPLTSTNKSDVIDELLGIYKDNKKASAALVSLARQAIMDRELQGSTAMDNGIAIPHARVAGIADAVVVVGVSPLGIDFGGEEKSRVFFLVLVSNESPSEHIQLLSSIARLCTSPAMCRRMAGSHDEAELYGLIKD